MSKKYFFIYLLFAVFSVLSVKSQNISVGDYRSAASGNWNALTTWTRWNGTTWLEPTAAQGWPGQYTNVSQVIIYNGNVVNLNVAVTAYKISTLDINGIDANSRSTLNIQIEVANNSTAINLNADLMSVRNYGQITFGTNKASVRLPTGAVITLNNEGRLDMGGNCNNNVRIYIGPTNFAVCTGGSADFSFQQLNDAGGTLDAQITDYSVYPLCINSSLSFSASYKGFASGTVYYEWRTTLPGYTTNVYTTSTLSFPSPLPVGTYSVTLTAYFTSNSGARYENKETRTFIVNPNAVGGTVNNPNTAAICGNTQPGSNLTLSGHTGNIQWQRSINNTTFTDIAGATTATLTPAQMGALTQITYFRAHLTTPCTNATSNTVTISVDPATVISSQNTAAQSVCVGDAFNPLTVTATGVNLTYQWYRNTTASNTGGTAVTTGTGGTTSSYTPPSSTAGTTYYYVVVSGKCGTVTSAVSGAITVVSTATAPAVSIAASNTTICQGSSVTFTATPTSGGTAPTYQWKNKGVNIPGATGVQFTTSTLAQGDVITVEMTSNMNASCLPSGAQKTVQSNTITMTVNPNVWKGGTSTAWNVAGNWTNGCVPASGADVIFDTNPTNDLVVDIDRIVGNLTVTNSAGKKIVIPTGLSLTVNNKLTNDNVNQILIKSESNLPNGSLIFKNPSTNNAVIATVEMYSKAYNGLLTESLEGVFSYRWQYFGIPITNVVANPTFHGSWVRRYDETINEQYHKWTQLNNESVLEPWKGYEITQEVPKTIVFQGTLVVGDKTISLPKSNVVWGSGYHIISNPYTAAIDVREMTFGTNTDATVYLYNTGTFAQWENNKGVEGSGEGQYIAIPKNTAGTGGIPFEIPSMQGFLVLNNGAVGSSGSVTIPYNATTSAAVKNTTMQRAASSDKSAVAAGKDEPLSYLAISVVGEKEKFADKTWIFSQEGTSRGFDNGWDGLKMMGAKGTPQLYSWEKSGMYQVNTVNDIDSTVLGFQSGSDELYTITIERSNIDEKYPYLALYDLKELRLVELNTYAPTSYTFFARNTEKAEKRFILHTKKIEQIIEEETNPIQIFTYADKIRIRNFKEPIGTVYVYDLYGKLLVKSDFENDYIIEVNARLQKGIYVVHVQGAKSKASEKLIIR